MKNLKGTMFLLFAIVTLGFGQVATTSFEFTASSLFHDAAYKTHIRTVYVHTLENFEPDKEYPVLIYLPGWPGNPEFYTFFTEVLGKLLDQGKVDPMIIFIPSGIGGLYTTTNYWDSSTNGGYGSYITKDLIKYINDNYPVKKANDGSHDRNHWILSGWSMGGGGAGRLAYKNPELFSGMASFSGDLAVDGFREIIEFSKKENNNNCSVTHPGYGSLGDEASYWTHLLWETASVFSPGPAPAYATFPLDENCNIIDSVWDKWKIAHADYLAEKYYKVDKNDKESMNVFLRVGKNEMFGTDNGLLNLYSLTKPFYDVLVENDVPVDYIEHNKGHSFDDAQVEELLLWADAHFKKSATKVENKTIVQPQSTLLVQNYPNPFNASTTIQYDLPQNGSIKIEIYNSLGKHIETLVDAEKKAGTFSVVWNAVEQPTGTYLCRMEFNGQIKTHSVILCK